MSRRRWKLCNRIVIVVRGLLLRLRRLIWLRLWVRDTERWKVLLLWLSQTFSTPRIKDLRHELHPLRWSSRKVVFDRLIPEGHKIVAFVVWREGNILTPNKSCCLSSSMDILTDTDRGAASAKTLSRPL
jgi:hypothetical protein